MDKQKPESGSSERQEFSRPTDVTKKDRFAGIKAYLTKRPSKKRLMIVGGISLGVLLVGSVLAFTLIGNDDEVTPVNIAEAEPKPEPEQKFYSALTGVETTEELSNKIVTAVMIENSVDARPQAGLEEAGVVFEAIAEGGITRFMALYQEAEPNWIGPVRSSRPYYVEWAAGFDAAYAHSGGSPKALALIDSLGVQDLDHGNHPNYFERVSNRFAPHNVYTDMARLDQLKSDKGFTSSSFTGFSRLPVDEETEDEAEVKVSDSETSEPSASEETIAAAEVVTTIDFDISSPLYNTSYTYNPESNSYARVMASQRHLDEKSGEQISPSVVVALYTDYSIDPNGIHSVYRTTGTGTALVFQEGTVIEATWRKTSRSADLQLLDSNDEPLQLTRGQTWITAIPEGRVSYSAS